MWGAGWGALVAALARAGTEAVGSFDLLCLFHVVEHFPRPVADLRALVAPVRPGGWIFIEVPHCIPWMFSEPVDTESYLGFFTPAAVRKLAGECGLAVIRLENCGPPIIEHYRRRWEWLTAQTGRRPWVVRAVRGGARRFGLLAARLAPSVWPVATEYDGYFDVYYQPGDERGLWLRALLQKPDA